MLRDQFQTDFITALKAKDKPKTEAMRTLLSAIKNDEIEKKAKLNDEEMISVLTKEQKKRLEAIELYQQGNRQDLVQKEQYELELIKQYLPQQLSKVEIEAEIVSIISNINGRAEFGQVMQAAMQQLKGKANGKVVADIVRRKLSHG